MAKKIAAVSGGRGLIGKNIVKLLVFNGWYVRVLTRQSDYRFKDNHNTEVIIGGVNDEEAIKLLLKDAEVVFHCAAELHDENLMDEVNVRGTACILNALSNERSVKYFCNLSSAGVIGPASVAEINEDTICLPSNLYERTKYEAELLVLQKKLQMNICILRPANVYDENSNWLLGLNKSLSLKNCLSLFLKGKEGAHLIHAKDVAAAAIYFINKPLHKPEVFFVSYDDDVRNTIIGVYKLCREMQVKTEWSSFAIMPNWIPYLIRIFVKGKSLHGKVRFSEEKLKHYGFSFPLGLEAGLKEICIIGDQIK